MIFEQAVLFENQVDENELSKAERLGLLANRLIVGVDQSRQGLNGNRRDHDVCR